MVARGTGDEGNKERRETSGFASLLLPSHSDTPIPNLKIIALFSPARSIEKPLRKRKGAYFVITLVKFDPVSYFVLRVDIYSSLALV